MTKNYPPPLRLLYKSNESEKKFTNMLPFYHFIVLIIIILFKPSESIYFIVFFN